jgi:hypothetical protein
VAARASIVAVVVVLRLGTPAAAFQASGPQPLGAAAPLGARAAPIPDLLAATRRPREARAAAERLVAPSGVHLFRGFQGSVVRPTSRLALRVAEQGGPTLDAAVVTWNGLPPASGALGAAAALDEADVCGRATLDLDQWSLGFVYTSYVPLRPPRRADLATVREIGVTAGLDLPEQEWWGQLIGDPIVGLYFESEASHQGASHVQIDLGPSLPLLGETRLALPACIGVHLDDGGTGAESEPFLSIGARLDLALRSRDLSDVTLSAGVNALLAGESAAELEGRDPSDVYLFVKLGFTF